MMKTRKIAMVSSYFNYKGIDMKIFSKKIICFILICVILISVGIIGCGCKKKAASFSEEEHIQRISERIDKQLDTWTYADGKKYEGYKVYPLYDENEELKHFLVEFEPCGFTFIRLDDEQSKIYSCIGVNTSMYRRSTFYGEMRTWSPYIHDKTLSQPYPDTEKKWIQDENGEQIYYKRSPYYVTQNSNNKKYLLESGDSGYMICAVKQDGVFVNLISNSLFTFAEDLYLEQAILYVAFWHGNQWDI